MPPMPQYLKVREYVIGRIWSATPGEYTRIEPELELCKLFNVSRITVRNALRQLTDDGYLIARRGMGTFINPEMIPGGVKQPYVGIFFGDGMLVNHGYAAALNALLASVGSLGMGFRLMNSPENLNSPDDYLKALSVQLAAVVWFWPGPEQLNFLRQASSRGLPALGVGRSYDTGDNALDSVVSDNYGLGRLLFQRLTDAGHERVLHVAQNISGHKVIPKTTLAGYRDAAEEAGHSMAPELAFDLCSLNNELPPLVEGRSFTAVYSSNAAVPAVMASLRAAGLSVPADVSYLTYGECDPCFFDGLESDRVEFPESAFRAAFGAWFRKRLLAKDGAEVFQRTIAAEFTPGETVKPQTSRRQTV